MTREEIEINALAHQVLDLAMGRPPGPFFTAVAWAVRTVADGVGAPLEEVLELICNEARGDGDDGGGRPVETK
jgi:hypothetical protein